MSALATIWLVLAGGWTLLGWHLHRRGHTFEAVLCAAGALMNLGFVAAAGTS